MDSRILLFIVTVGAVAGIIAWVFGSFINSLGP